MSDDGYNLVDVNARITLAKEAFNKSKEFLTKGGLSRTQKQRMVKVLVWPVVLYGCKTWTLRKEEINRIEALEMWLWRSLKKIKWQDNISNDEVLTTVNENRCLITTIGEREKELDRTCVEGRWTVERRAGRKNVFKC